jgi:hypothetical protein
MKTPEFKDMDVEYTRTPGKEDLNLDKVIPDPPEEEINDSPPIQEEKDVPDSLTDRKNPKKELKKLRKSEIRLNKKYQKLKEKLAIWIYKQEKAGEKFMQKKKLIKDLRELIIRSVELKEPDKNIVRLKKVRKSMKKAVKEKTGAKKIKKKIRKLEKKMGRIENKLV